MHPYREAAARPPPPLAVKRPAVHVADLVQVRADGRVGCVTMVEPEGPVYVVTFSPSSCGLFFRSQILKLAAR